MKPARRPPAKLGIGISIFSLLCVGAGAVVAASSAGLALGLLALGGLLYLLGGFTTIAAHGYRRGTNTYLTMMAVRMLFAAATMILFMRLMMPR